METHSLICHPDTPAKTVRGITVTLEPKAHDIWLRFDIEGPPNELLLPHPAEPARRSGLWQTTCMEAFAMDSAGGGYCEFNFAPSGEWAAYRFDAYREGMADLAFPSGPAIRLNASSDSHLIIEASIPRSAQGQSMALAAVIEEIGGTKSYWALAHPPGKPDFHHPDCFGLYLPAPENT